MKCGFRIFPFAALIFMSLANSLNSSAGEIIGVGLRAGMNMSRLDGDDAESSGRRFKSGFCGGLFIDYTIVEGFSVQTEALYSEKGSRYERGGEIRMEYDYLEFPVLVKAAFMEGNFKPNISLGPALGILLKAKQISDYPGDPYRSGEIDAKDSLKNWDISLVLGLGLDYYLGFGKATIDIRFDKGIVSIDDSGAGLDLKNQVFSLLIGFSL